jgi:hypothetical protein
VFLTIQSDRQLTYDYLRTIAEEGDVDQLNREIGKEVITEA